jgi:hypothetical protein
VTSLVEKEDHVTAVSKPKELRERPLQKIILKLILRNQDVKFSQLLLRTVLSSGI